MAEGEEPVSPTSQYHGTSAFNLSILAVFETNIPIDDSSLWTVLEKTFLPVNPRFSSILITDEKGRLKWKKVKVRAEDHVKIPTFAGNTTTEFYDEQLQDYLSDLTVERLPRSRPLWEIHLVKYPTRTAAGSLVIKLHHVLGDGFSLLGALFSTTKRMDDPSLPFTFPSSSSSSQLVRSPGIMGVLAGVRRGLSVLFNTAEDFTRSLLGSSLLVDDKTPLRSGRAGVEFMPLTISTITIPLTDIKKIKGRLQRTSTVNDVIAGTVFYGIHLYMLRSEGSGASKARMTAVVLANTRAIKSYRTVEEMARPDAEAPWGNHVGLLLVPIPRCKDVAAADPVQFVLRARKIIEKRKNSLGLYLTAKLLHAITMLRGPEAAARFIATTARSATMSISNMVGPEEQMLIAGHPVTGFYFMTAGVPQSLGTSVVSYAGKLRVALAAEKGFINSELLVACLEEAFGRILEAAVGKRP